METSGQYVCDSACIRWTNANIRSHILAVAEVDGELLKFLQWYSAAGNAPNISVLAMQGMPSGRGPKGGRPKRKRARELTVPETFMSVNKFLSLPPAPPPPPPSRPSLPMHNLPPSVQAQQSQVHSSGNVNVATVQNSGRSTPNVFAGDSSWC